MTRADGHRRHRLRDGAKTVPSRVWPDGEPGLPPLDGILPALAGFTDISGESPLDIEVRLSSFLAELGAGSLEPLAPGEPDHEELVNGLVEVCLHHLEEGPPRAVLDFLWVVDAFGLGYLHWPLRELLEASTLPSSPAWARAVGHAEVTGTHLVTHEMGDGLDVAITARHPGADGDHVLAVYVDANLDGLAKDVLVHHDSAEFLRMSSDAPGMTVTEVDRATAGAIVDAAVDVTFETGPMAPVAKEFSSLFTVLDHYVAKLPAGGAPPPPPEPASPHEQAAVLDRFLATEEGAPHAGARDVLLDAVEFVTDELGGDPLRWSPVVTHLTVAGWLPLSTHGETRRPELVSVLEAFVPWAHREHGWGDRYVTDALAVLAPGGAAEPGAGLGRVDVLERAVEAGIDLDDEQALDAFLDEYLAD